MSQQQQMQLGSKERSLFKQVVEHYEAKHFKKGDWSQNLSLEIITDLLQVSKQRTKYSAKIQTMATRKP